MVGKENLAVFEGSNISEIGEVMHSPKLVCMHVT